MSNEMRQWASSQNNESNTREVGIDFQNFSALDPNYVDPLLEDSQNMDDAIAILNIKDPVELAATLK